MLFFKEIKDEKLDNPEFNAFYKKECHLCAITLQVVSSLEKRKEELDNILKIHKISHHSYNALKSGDHCQPEQVLKLCRHLKIEDGDLVNNCPRL